MLWGNTIHNKKQPEKELQSVSKFSNKINAGKFSQIEENYNEHKTTAVYNS